MEPNIVFTLASYLTTLLFVQGKTLLYRMDLDKTLLYRMGLDNITKKDKGLFGIIYPREISRVWSPFRPRRGQGYIRNLAIFSGYAKVSHLLTYFFPQGISQEILILPRDRIRKR
jgi:hypothetical protein